MKPIYRNWNLFELIWLATFTIFAIVNAIMTKDTFFGFTIFLSGIFCVVLTAKGNIWSFIFGIYNSFTYGYLSYQNGLFGEAMLNLAFFVPMSIIGWIMWKKNVSQTDSHTVKMKKLTPQGIVILFAITILAVIGYGAFLATLSKQNNPYLDAFTVATYVIATFLTTLRYREQWLIYIVVNLSSIGLWIYRSLEQSTDSVMMLLMYTAFLVNAIYGFYRWSKGANKAENECTTPQAIPSPTPNKGA